MSDPTLTIIGPEQIEKLEALKKFAEENVISDEEGRAIAAGKAPLLGERPGYVAQLSPVMAAVYNICNYPDGAKRQLTIQCPTKIRGVNKSPNPFVYELVMSILGFRNPLESAFKDFEAGCILVFEYVNEEDELAYFEKCPTSKRTK